MAKPRLALLPDPASPSRTPAQIAADPEADPARLSPAAAEVADLARQYDQLCIDRASDTDIDRLEREQKLAQRRLDIIHRRIEALAAEKAQADQAEADQARIARRLAAKALMDDAVAAVPAEYRRIADELLVLLTRVKAADDAAAAVNKETPEAALRLELFDLRIVRKTATAPRGAAYPCQTIELPPLFWRTSYRVKGTFPPPAGPSGEIGASALPAGAAPAGRRPPSIAPAGDPRF